MMSVTMVWTTKTSLSLTVLFSASEGSNASGGASVSNATALTVLSDSANRARRWRRDDADGAGLMQKEYTSDSLSNCVHAEVCAYRPGDRGCRLYREETLVRCFAEVAT